MVKELLFELTVALALSACLLALGCSPAPPAPPQKPVAPGALNTVEVTFDGLMVFRQVGDHYEVGILDSDTATNHKLRITVGDTVLSDGKLAQFVKTKPWTLSVVTTSGNQTPNIKVRQYKGCSRLQDTKDPQLDIKHVFDLCWLLDMETELNDGKPLNMDEGRLTPIIKLNSGELYTKYNYDALDAGKGKFPTYTPLGYVSDMIALKVDLKPDEKFVLSAGNQVIFSLTSEGVHCAGIFNQPTDDTDKGKSHFDYYYKLFNVPESEQYHIRLSQDLRTHPPNLYTPEPIRDRSDKNFNVLSDIRARCWDHELCGAVFLGKSTGPLK